MTAYVWPSQCSAQGKESTHTVNSTSNECNFCFLPSLSKKFSVGWPFHHTSKDQILMEIIKDLSNAVKPNTSVECYVLVFDLEPSGFSYTAVHKTFFNTGCILRNAGTVWNKAAAKEEIMPEIDVWNRKNMDHSSQNYDKWQRCYSKELCWEMFNTDTSVNN